MPFNSTTAIKEAFNVDPTEHYRNISNDFEKFHEDPANVLLHFITTPLGVLGAFALLRRYTKSSSMGMSLMFFYLLSLAPAVPSGVFAGTAFLCALIVICARQLQLSYAVALILIACGYLVQDMAHLATGERTFQSTYSDGGHIDLHDPIGWLQNILEHTYYLLPLCIHVAMPFLGDVFPADIKQALESPVPSEMSRLHAFAWWLGPLMGCALGSYCLDSKNGFCFFPGMPYFHRVLQCSLLSGEVIPREANDTTAHNPNEQKRHVPLDKEMHTIREWALSNNPPDTQSSHWWYTDLQGATRKAFEDIAGSTQVMSMFRELFSTKNYCVDIVTGMNEIYISGPARFDENPNSDNVFYTRHVDGPFGLLPFVSVYRCIVGLDRNEKITTHFPLAHIEHAAKKGDVLAFDFNREVHYISCDESKAAISDKFRVVLKLHYCVYPRVLAPLGWFMYRLNINYNMTFRALFLKTINPQSLYEHWLAWNVNANTILFDKIETYFGQRNLIYLIFMGALWYLTGVYEIFFILTSYVHYFRYISTFYYRKGIDFGSFKRDVLVFKNVALAQLFYHYFFPAHHAFEWDYVGLAMIVAGYAVCMMATSAIGIDRTYFGAELGLCEPKWIDQFPYGYIPHPMIVSQLVALLGLYKAAHYRAEWPYVVPVHMVLYTVHMLQEEFGIYQRESRPRSTVAKKLA